MVIRQLQYLVTLARERHFGRAAAACNVTQPTLSAGIRHLESELGVPLVERGQRFQGLTADGERVLGWAQRILADCEAMTQELGGARSGLAGRLRLGVVPSALPAAALLTRPFHGRHPAVQVSVHSMSSIEIQQGLEQFEIDLGLTYLDNEPLSGVRAQPLYRERYVLLVPEAVPFAGRASVTWAEASGVPLALLTPNMQNRRIVDAAFRRAGSEPHAEIETNSLVSLIAHVQSGGWSSVVPQMLIEVLGQPKACRALPLVDPVVTHVIGVVIADREPASPIARAFMALASPFDGTPAAGRPAG
ncbi:MAG: LysR family transcriptional regulator [Alphaproteobacteria bacterium]|nr:LysR family transcriptional regulator [Alphaproteobacteria bacterium]